MNCFKKDYSKCYDLFYKNKKYKKEFYFIKKIIRKYLKEADNLLDLGCGTGQYSNLMTKLNLNVLAVDKSNHMLKVAKKKYKKNHRLNFKHGNILNLKVNKQFDIVSALFHILSYQITEKKINKFFSCSRKYLKKNGILVFDFWFRDGL